ncbi:MAG: LytTR family DNA-binding domain-containing protein, partial [Hyphomonadaceae bacterium]
MSLTKREIRELCTLRIAIDWSARGRDFAIFLAIGTFLAFIDPYSATATLPLWGKWLYWTGLIMVGVYVGEAATWAMEKLFPNLHAIVSTLILSLVAALAVTATILTIQSIIGPYVPTAYWLGLYFSVWVISIAMTGIGFLMDQTFNNKAPATEDLGKGIDTFLERLPIKYRGAALYAVSSEDHYLRVHTERGEELILMRLADALRELAGADGLQTHRSWWVAVDGVADTAKTNGRTVLILKSGAEAPVSRSYAKAVREKGLG